ncbi:MAG TPA: methyltransferase [Chitinophagaceae bacterium]
MIAALRNIVAHTYKPLLVKYLSKTRVYKYDGIRLEIPPQVFHPGFFFSTRLLLNHIKQFALQGKKFLEPGCGSGLISLYAAKKGAVATASDINPVAIEYLKKNSRYNQTTLTIIQSDLFKDIPEQSFDIIAINPPYYKKQPLTPKDYAWFCGENGEYFTALFKNLGNYIHPGTEISMVLFEGCDMEMIENTASENGFDLILEKSYKNFLEKNFIYKIEKV